MRSDFFFKQQRAINRLPIPPTATLPFCLYCGHCHEESSHLSPVLSRLVIFYRDASLAFLQLVTQWSNHALSVTEERTQILFFTRIELTISALAGCVRDYLLDHLEGTRKLTTRSQYLLDHSEGTRKLTDGLKPLFAVLFFYVEAFRDNSHRNKPVLFDSVDCL